MSRSNAPNLAFARALERAAMSHKGLARRIRDLAAQHGERNAADHVSVKRWLDGTQPRTETALLIAAALSERLGRAQTPASLGFTADANRPSTSSVVDVSAQYPHDVNDASRSLAVVATTDLDNPDDPGLMSWDADAARSAIGSYLFGHGSDGESLEAAKSPVDADAIRRTTAHLMALDFQLGGGHTRKLLLFYFRDQVLPLFDALPVRQRGELFVATAELAQMLGWSAYDAGRHGAAQRYFASGLRLARASGDTVLGARLLANMSHQANYLGRFHTAVELARAAQHAANGSTSSRTTAMFHAMEARALASLNDGVSCAAALHRAESLLDRADIGDDPEWISYFTEAELSGEAAHCFRDLRRPAETGYFGGLAVAPIETPPRTRAFIDMVMAAGALQGNDLDEAVALARGAIELAGPLQSSRYQRYVRDFLRSAADAHPRSPLVVELTAVAAPLLDRRMPA